MAQYWSPNDPCNYCGAMSNTSHTSDCPDEGYWDEDGNETSKVDPALDEPSPALTREQCMANHPSNTCVDETQDAHPMKEAEMIELTRYAKKPFYVDSIQVTGRNMQTVADWCGGDVITTDEDGAECEPYIQVDVTNPQTPSQTRAVVGSWVLKAVSGVNTGFKVYGNKAFLKNFDITDEPRMMIFPTRREQQPPSDESKVKKAEEAQKPAEPEVETFKVKTEQTKTPTPAALDKPGFSSEDGKQ